LFLPQRIYNWSILNRKQQNHHRLTQTKTKHVITYNFTQYLDSYLHSKKHTYTF
jgi:hypothetical protein